MIALVRSSLAGQYGAALQMFSRCFEHASSDAWTAPVGKFPFWHVAYHALYYTDLYVSTDEQSFRPQPFHLENSNFLGPPSSAPEKKFVAGRPYHKEKLASYLATCRAKVKSSIERETETTLAGPSGFSWLKFSRLELHVYNIRHTQHHIGQLTALLRRLNIVAADWVRTEAP
jgi:hypothetical protein